MVPAGMPHFNRNYIMGKAWGSGICWGTIEGHSVHSFKTVMISLLGVIVIGSREEPSKWRKSNWDISIYVDSKSTYI
jgi:hypothetical protein